METIVAYSLCSLLFIVICINAFIAKKPVNFYSNIYVNAEKISDIKNYNKTCGKL